MKTQAQSLAGAFGGTRREWARGHTDCGNVFSANG